MVDSIFGKAAEQYRYVIRSLELEVGSSTCSGNNAGMKKKKMISNKTQTTTTDWNWIDSVEWESPLPFQIHCGR